MGEPDLAPLFDDAVNDQLGRHGAGVDVLVDVQRDEVVDLAAEGIRGVELRPLDQRETIRSLKPVRPGDGAVVGEAQKAVALVDVPVDALLRGLPAIGIGSVGVNVALQPGVPVLRVEAEGTGEGAL